MVDKLIDGLTCHWRRAALEEVVDLRHAALRRDLARETAVFAGDEAPTTLHYAIEWAGAIVCCATLHPSEWEGRSAWQLRGMASRSDLRGRGLGRLMLERLEQDVRRQAGPLLLWCNARAPAVGFYEAMGWRVRSAVFDIPTAGPHQRMVRDVRPAASAEDAVERRRSG